ncbi:MAG: HAD-IIB family hydrolase [Gammaproteobacteria bacterium]|nr:HAD-IIB family hydrolase [Gammaproteobacteria bacterium]MBQ0838516.1 HAD-IIB family hydrolase [Gammaproteobacteria bacterium]
MSEASELLIFTDLDGTLLDHYSYSFEPARPVIDFLNSAGIPWILNTSKTLAELSELSVALNNSHPMILENGGGIAIPRDHPITNQAIAVLANDATKTGFHLITLGATRTAILDALAPLRDQFSFRGFSDMSAEELSESTGLTVAQAKQAMDRQFSEPLVWQDSEANLAVFAAQLNQRSLSLLRGGRFIHVIGDSDKGKAMAWLSSHWPQSNRLLTTVALGDGENDIAMLLQADFPIIVRSPVHEPPLVKHHRPVLLTHLTGPAGWAEALVGVLNKFGYTLPKDASSADVSSTDTTPTDISSNKGNQP